MGANVPKLATSEGQFDNTVEILGKITSGTKMFEKFGGHHCPLSGQFWGSFRCQQGSKCTFLYPTENPDTPPPPLFNTFVMALNFCPNRLSNLNKESKMYKH